MGTVVRFVRSWGPESNKVALLRNDWKGGVTKPLVIWTVTDDRAGNIAQAEGLARGILRRRPTQIHARRITLKPMAAKVPSWLSRRFGVRQEGWPFSGIETGREYLEPPWPDLMIGAGRRVAPIVAALRRLHGIRAVQLLDPQMKPSAFDAVIAPEHDELKGKNVIDSVGALGKLTYADIALAAKRSSHRFENLPSPRLAVLVGGPSKSSGFDMDDGNAKPVIGL